MFASAWSLLFKSLFLDFGIWNFWNGCPDAASAQGLPKRITRGRPHNLAETGSDDVSMRLYFKIRTYESPKTSCERSLQCVLPYDRFFSKVYVLIWELTEESCTFTVGG